MIVVNEYLNGIINMDMESIDKIVRKGYVIPICDEIVSKYINVDDISLYRMYVENLSMNNSHLKDIVEVKRKKKYDDIFAGVTKDGLLDEYKNIYEDIINGREINTSDVSLVMGLYGSHEEIFNFLYDESCDKLHEILVDRYFEDNFHNFMVNLEMILNFINSIKDNNLIDIDRLELYKKIYDFRNLSGSEKINLYNVMNNGINYVELFYDDYRKCKDYAYSMYNENVLKPEKMNKSELSLTYGVDVYELDGEDFTAFVHQTKVDRSTGVSNVWKDVDNRESSVKSFSMIDQNHFDTIYGYDSYVVLGFSSLDINRIIHVYHSDSFTDVNRGSDRVNEILSSDDLMNNTMGYNEIFYLRNNLSIKHGNGSHTKLVPSYVMCYDYITDLEVEIAKKYNIPIVLFHTNKYENKVDPRIDYSSNVYLEEYNKKKK